MLRRIGSRITIGFGATLLVVGVSACAQQKDAANAPVIEEKRFSVTPASLPVRVSFLSGELRDLKVTQGIEQGTGRVVNLPKLSGTLKLKNTSEDQTARLVEGTINYVDAQGALIPLAEGREASTFRFYSYQTDRLDPGMETTQSIDVPFPAAALDDQALREVRLELTYIPSPYEEKSVDLAVSVKG